MDIYYDFDQAFLNDELLTPSSTSSKLEDESIPNGTYEVKIQKMELVSSKKGQPMVSIWFKIINGDYSGRFLFMHQVITRRFQLEIVEELLKKLDTGFEIKFESYTQFGKLVKDCFDKVSENFEFGLEYSTNSKGYDEYRIVAVFPPEDVIPF